MQFVEAPAIASRRAAVAFNDANQPAGSRLAWRLMTDSHTFIHSDGDVLCGDWSSLIPVGSTLIAVGRSVCSTEPALEGPAIWTATTADDEVSDWRVYEDTPAIRRRLGLGEASD